MVEIRVNGKTFNLFKQVNISRSLDNFSGEGRIIVSQQVNDSSFIIVNDLIEIFLDGIQVLTGHAEKISDSESNDSHDVSYSVRDKIQDIIDSSVPDNVKTLTDVTTFAGLCQQVVDGLGMDINVIDDVGATFNNDLKAASVGQNCGDFLREYARKVGVFLGTDGKGNILITKTTNTLTTILAAVPNFKDNNIKKSNIDLDYSKRFNKYVVRSNGNLASENRTKKDLNVSGEAFDNEIRSTRIFEKIAEKHMTADECKKAAAEEANIRRIRGFSYSVTVAGFTGNGELWNINNIVKVKDFSKNVIGSFLIKDVSWEAANSGEITNMKITYPDGYQGTANPTAVEAKTTTPAITYTVRPGDTLGDIAARNNISTTQLAQANPQIRSRDLIFPDQSIVIPTTDT